MQQAHSSDYGLERVLGLNQEQSLEPLEPLTFFTGRSSTNSSRHEERSSFSSLDHSSFMGEVGNSMERLNLAPPLSSSSSSASSPSASRNPNATCFVFYLPPSITEETLRQLFMRHGTVLNAYVPLDKVTKRPRGFGFVDFSTPAEAQAAVAGLDKFPLDGKFLSVSLKTGMI